jgi:hypothetical protein
MSFFLGSKTTSSLQSGERERERMKKGAESRWILFVEVMTVD